LEDILKHTFTVMFLELLNRTSEDLKNEIDAFVALKKELKEIRDKTFHS
jgi:hypothetical protein